MTSDLGRLEGLYKGYTDGQLVELDEDRLNLTDEAQVALAAEMKRRGLAAAEGTAAERESGFGPGVSGILASNIDVLDRLPGLQEGATDDGMEVLIGFFNGHELAQATDALEEADIAYDVKTVGGDAMAGVPASFDVRVAPGDRDAAQKLLRERMQLFPLPEMAAPLETVDDGTMEVLGDFETELEAQEVMAMLREAGMEAKLVPSEMSGELYAVEVKTVQRESALGLVAGRLGIG